MYHYVLVFHFLIITLAPDQIFSDVLYFILQTKLNIYINIAG